MKTVRHYWVPILVLVLCLPQLVVGQTASAGLPDTTKTTFWKNAKWILTGVAFVGVAGRLVYGSKADDAYSQYYSALDATTVASSRSNAESYTNTANLSLEIGVAAAGLAAVSWLVDAGIDNQAAAEERQRQEIAAARRHEEAARDSLENIARLKRMAAQNLIRASQSGDLGKVKELLDNGTDINGTNEGNETALLLASCEGKSEIVKYLLDRGADVNIVNFKGVSALMFASDRGHTTVVRELLRKGAKVDISDNLGQTALLWASMAGHDQIVQILLDAGADLAVSNSNDGKTPLDWARERGFSKIVQVLEKYKKIRDAQKVAEEKKAREEERKAKAEERRRLENLPRYAVRPFGYGPNGRLTGYATSLNACEKWIRTLNLESDLVLAMMLQQGELKLLPNGAIVRVSRIVTVQGTGMNAGYFESESNGTKVSGYIPAVFLQQIE